MVLLMKEGEFRFVADPLVTNLKIFLEEILVYMNSPLVLDILGEERILLKPVKPSGSDRFYNSFFVIYGSRIGIIGKIKTYTIRGMPQSLLARLRKYKSVFSEFHNFLFSAIGNKKSEKIETSQAFVAVIYLRKFLPKEFILAFRNLALTINDCDC